MINTPVITSESEGIFAVWKPAGITSYSAIYKIKKLTGKTKIGHAGTLDPLAEGILVVAIGRESTKKLFGEDLKEKEYLATFELGSTSSTDDDESEKIVTPNPDIPSKEKVTSALQTFIGEIIQKPPRYSALKMGGVPLYKKARRGEVFEPQPRPVTIQTIELISYEWPEVKVRVVTGPGTYIRSLARDLGEKLGTGGYLKKLIRTRVGPYTKKEAFALP